MFFNGFDPFGDMGEIETATFEVYVGQQCVQRQQMQAPLMMLQAQFQQAMQEVAQQKGRQPMSIKMTRDIKIWDEFENKEIIRKDCWIRFDNYDRGDAE